MNNEKHLRRTLSGWGLSLMMAVFFLCAFSTGRKLYADQILPALSDRTFNRELTEMVGEYGQDDVPPAAARRNPYLAERLIIKSTDPAIDPEDYGAVDGIRDRNGMVILQFDSVRDTKRAEAMLEQEDSTEYIVPDRYVFLQDDAYTQEAAHSMDVYDDIRRMMSEGPASIGADELGAELKDVYGQVKVAVLDTGVSYKASYLSGRIDQVNGCSFIESCDVDVSKDDPGDCVGSAAGHGTHVSGIIARCTEQVGNKVMILPVRVMNNRGTGTISTIIMGIQYAADHGAQIINMSLGGDADPSDTAVSDAVQYAVGKGATVVVAAGNESDNTMKYEPSNINECVVVGAVDGYKDRALFSNYGQTLDVVAPGVSILSCVHYYMVREGSLVQVVYAALSGTSMATPHASGAAALIKLKYPGADPQQVEQILQLSTRDLGAPGWDMYYGHGFLDLTLLTGAPYNQVSKAAEHVNAKKTQERKAAEEAAKKKAAEEAEKKAAEEAAKKKAAEEAAFAEICRDTRPHANADYVIPLQCGKRTDGLKVAGLGARDYVVSWASSDPSIADVSGRPDGTCTVTAGNTPGNAMISAVTASRIMISFDVRVQKKKIALKGVAVPTKKLTLQVGQSYDLQAEPKPVSAGKPLKYSSSRKSVATVSGDGIITARGAGKTVITVKCGKKKVKVKVNVVQP